VVVAIVPSYLKKLAKAKEDLAALEAEIERYVMRDPYRVVESAEGKRQPKVRRLEITGDPANTEIPIIAGGIIYNLRSGLDHFFSALVPKKQRRSAQFPRASGRTVRRARTSSGRRNGDAGAQTRRRSRSRCSTS
jgi:hypothetical protein